MLDNVLFCISSLGLGHATRTLAILRSYLGTHRIHVISHGTALRFLRQELDGHDVVFHEVEDYPPLERGSGWRAYWYLMVDILRTLRVMRREHAFVEALARKHALAFVVSDGRYGCYLEDVPSFLISHQIRFVMPKGLSPFQGIADRFNFRRFRRFAALLIPDYEDPGHSLAGRLSHHPMLARLPHHYVGVLSSLAKRETAEDIGYLFSISGYIREHKGPFLEALAKEVGTLPGRKVFVLGNYDGGAEALERLPDTEVHPSVAGELREELFNRARVVVARFGYTTVMDLAELEKPGFLTPTPGQTEQEYLADYHRGGGHVLSPPATLADLAGGRITPFAVPWKTAESVRRVRAVIGEYGRQRAFAIVIPAHNEEKYLARTLEHVRAQRYPRERFETIVVENGSTDATLAVAKRHEDDRLRVVTSAKGVSRAKNEGARHVSADADWVIFLDADTVLSEDFLATLDRHLRRHDGGDLAIGTTEVHPLERRDRIARFWFMVYNLGHRLTRTSFAIQILRAPLAKKVRFDESLTFTEDLRLIEDARRFGRFFYVPTKAVWTSVRRFKRVGWLRLFLQWNRQALLVSGKRLRSEDYDVIR